jgi:hypothetical protein
MSKLLQNIDNQINEDQRTQRLVVKYLIEGSTTVDERQVMVESVMGLLGNIIYSIDKIASIATKNVAARQQMDTSGELNISSIAPLATIADAAVLAATISQADVAKIPDDIKYKAIGLYKNVENKNPSDKSVTMLRRMVELAGRLNPNVNKSKQMWQQTLNGALESLQRGDINGYVQTLQKVKNALVKLRQTSADVVQNVPVVPQQQSKPGPTFQY